MEDPDAEAAFQELAVPVAPGAVLGTIAEEPGDVVPTVVVDREKPPSSAQDSVRFGQLRDVHAAEGGPQAQDDVHGGGGEVGHEGRRGRVVPNAGTERLEAGGNRRPGSVHEHDVAIGDGSKRLDASKDLALDIERGRQPAGEVDGERKRKVRHGDGSIGPLPTVGRRDAPGPHATRQISGRIRGMLASVRAMPGPIRLFLAYALVLLAGIGISLRFVVDLAISAPVSLPGVVVMVLLAYSIFTITLVLQRKEAARALALGLSSLTIPPIPWALVVGQPVIAIFFTALALLLIRGLRRPEVAAYLSEP